MGTTVVDGITRSQMIRDLTNREEHKQKDGLTRKYVCLAHAWRGNSFKGSLWAVFEISYWRGEVEVLPPYRFICCFAMQRYRLGDRDSSWSYKDVTESMGPYQTSCPLSYLSLVPPWCCEVNERWRERVVRDHLEVQRKTRETKARRASWRRRLQPVSRP